MTEWQAIETAPVDGTEVLILHHNRAHLARYVVRETTTNGKRDTVYSYSGWVWAGAGWGKSEPTHWAPLPPLPVSKGVPDELAAD